MATTTPNYGWPVPTSTDLVKDGAVAIESLGDAADATMATMVPKSIVDAKGDIIAATAADTVSRLAVGANNTVLTADSSTATGLKWAAAAGGGKVLQVVEASFSTEVNTTSDAYSDLGLSASITPSSASSKVFVLGVLNAGKTSTASTETAVNARLLRGATTINQVLSWAFYTNSGVQSRANMPAFMYLDSPATTSSTTYKIQVAAAVDLRNVIFNWTGAGSVAPCRIFLLEIGA
jgi:hypothetical protein